MSFQIRQSLDSPVPISISELDKEAAELWGKAVHPKDYAYPDLKPEKFDSIKEELNFYFGITNWFDMIGWHIHSGLNSWDAIRDKILEYFGNVPEEELKAYRPIWGYVELVNLWQSKGYIPVTLID